MIQNLHFLWCKTLPDDDIKFSFLFYMFYKEIVFLPITFFILNSKELADHGGAPV